MSIYILNERGGLKLEKMLDKLNIDLKTDVYDCACPG